MTTRLGPVGLIGTGTMGNPIARQLLASGFELAVNDIREGSARDLVEAGALWCRSPAEVARHSRIVLTSLPGPAEVTAVVTEPEGLLASSRPGDVHVDLSTISFAAARTIWKTEAAQGVAFVDAPVSGGRFKAADGTLSVMASGDHAAFERVKPVLSAIGEQIFHLGDDPGAGTLAKLVNNLIILCSGLLAQEGIVLAAKAGLDPSRLMPVLSASSASLYTQMLPMALARNFDDAFFTLALAEKDVQLALESARDLGVPMVVTQAAHDVYARARTSGLGDKVFFATLACIEEAGGVEPLS